MTQDRNDTVGASSPRRWVFYAVLFVLGFALAAVFLDADVPRNVGRSIYKRWQEFVWDSWSKGVIEWGDYSLNVPVGRYGWIVHKDEDLLVFPRDTQGIVSILIKRSARAQWPFRKHVEFTCVEKKLCSNLDQTSVRIGGRQAEVIIYEDKSPGVTVRLNAYIYLKDPEILLSIGAENAEELKRSMKFSEGLLEQMILQTRR